MERRVWVKKPDGIPTNIRILSTDLVDDLKTAVLVRYPSIARSCDSAELVIRMGHSPWAPIPTTNPNGQSHRLTNISLRREQTASPLSGPRKFELERELQPDHLIGKLLDQYYPNGMTMSDAFILDYPHPNDSRPGSAHPSVSHPSGTHSHSTQPRERELFTPVREIHAPHAIVVPRPSSQVGDKPPRSVSASEGGRAVPMGSHAEKSVSHAGAFDGGRHFHSGTESGRPFSAGPEPAHSYDSFPILPDSGFPPRYSAPLPAGLRLERVQTEPGTNSKPFGGHFPGHSVSHSYGGQGHAASGFHGGAGVSRGRASSADEATPVLLLPRNFSVGGSTKPKNAPLLSLVELETPTENSPTELPEKFREVGANPARENAGTNTVPRIRHPKLSKQTVSATDKVLPRIRVLIVEDNKVNIRILSMFMRQRNISYALANNGQEAVDRWREGGFHLVLMDIQLPVLSGIEATEEIRRLERINKIGVFAENESGGETLPVMKDMLALEKFRSPVIIVALTASTMDGDKTDALTAGCNDFLTKPVKHEWLQNKIIEWGCMQALIDFEGWG